jgi:hypothetical protein
VAAETTKLCRRLRSLRNSWGLRIHRMRPLERRVEVQPLGDGTYRVAVYVVVNSTPLMERKTEGISTSERAEKVASEYRQQLGIDNT